MSWFSRGGGEAPATSSAGGAFGGAGSSRWINMDTNQIKNFGGELTGENDAFSKTFGIELTRQQRIMGFVGCLIAGFVLSLLGTLLLITGSLATFAVLYSIGVVISLTGTGFLLGFMKQFKQMFAKVRIAFTAVMIVAFIMVWISAFAIDSTVSVPLPFHPSPPVSWSFHSPLTPHVLISSLSFSLSLSRGATRTGPGNRLCHCSLRRVPALFSELYPMVYRLSQTHGLQTLLRCTRHYTS